ncbi:MBL fold metallo-hydrolase [Parachryseolinea silvisoli]|uniref:MBL fold metallo-hydrolase n=1 Tax=Parachryseolinea silvisoli TaxID=2873601 RepID=UPI002265C230|nr:MBL fold metallo-hydrolase [Parachryseolinea silvisoli]MCD9019838.1 MBL fold metallo-hydrolase [Parachryseolinea silvisoli]
MRVEQIYTGCLAQGAYYIESAGEAVIIDPLREVGPYLEKARRNKATIRYVLETHFHADFVSGHLDLAAKSGARIVYGPTAKPSFDAHIAHDGEELKVGEVTIKVLHTPGHTLESTTYLLRDAQGKDYAIFSGDTLFLGDVGRPDLAQKAAHLSQEDLAGMLFDSLRTKLMPLADDVIVYPAHGAGSACGKHMMKETVDTLGNQKKINYALRADMTRDEFIREVTDGLLPPPAYFPENVKLNKEGYESIDAVMQKGTRALTAEEFELAANETGALVLDTRSPQEFAKGYIPNAINIGIDGSFAPWVGALVPGVMHPLLIVADSGREEEIVMRLARVGYDNTLGYLQGGVAAWKEAGKEVEKIKSISATEFEKRFQANALAVFDVRKPGEFEAEHVDGAVNTPLDFLNDHLASIPKEGDVYLHCAGGYRSMVAASILKARGWDNIVDVDGGFKAIAATSIPRTNFTCSSKKA